MNISGEKKTVAKSIQDVFDFAKTPQNHEILMPEGLEKFESTDEGYFFQIKGMPGVALKLKELVEPTKVVYTSAKDSLDFDLSILMQSITETETEVQLIFEGKFNPFIKMMVEKPLTSFITSLTQNLPKI